MVFLYESCTDFARRLNPPPELKHTHTHTHTHTHAHTHSATYPSGIELQDFYDTTGMWQNVSLNKEKAFLLCLKTF